MSTVKTLLSILVTAACGAVSTNAAAGTIACNSEAKAVKAMTITEPWFPVKTRFQIDTPNLEPLLETSILVAGPGPSCVVAYFSAVVRPTDNYVVFQATLDGVPMHGHTVTSAQPKTPVVIESEETDKNLQRLVAHHFFAQVNPGMHRIRVSVAAGSNIDLITPIYPAIEAPVLSIKYR
jgi:hypothetical protein